MEIRKAKPEDSVTIASLLFLAMEDIVFGFIGEKSRETAISFLEELVSESKNQYSYQNCWVLIVENEVVAVACIYDGAHLQSLRKPVGEKIALLYNSSFNPEDETQAGEIYIDCVGVSAAMHGTGLGTVMFKFLIEEYAYKSNKVLGLLVDKDNPRAKKLYLKLGFEVVGEKKLMGKELEHMQIMRV